MSKSPNFGERAGGVKPSLIIIHYTGMVTAAAALERLCDPASEVSAHYFIDEGGQVLNLVDEEYRAWHAGVSHWRGEADINSHSIGIELVNPGHEFGYEDFPGVQIAALITLCKEIMGRYEILPESVLGHSDIAPGRKSDPGEKFPWEALACEGVGLWPAPEEGDCDSHEKFHRRLIGFGYNPEVSEEERLSAFCQRYYPENLPRLKLDSHCALRLSALIRMQNLKIL